MNSRQLYFRILSYFKPYRAVVVVAVICMAIAGGVDALMLKLLKNVVDFFSEVKQGDTSLWFLPTVLFGLGLVRLLSTFGNEYLGAWLTGKVQQDMRDQVFARFLRMPVRYFDQSSTGVLLSRITFDVNQVMDAGLNVITILVKDSVLAIGLLITMVVMDWQLTLFCLIILPGAALSIKVVAKRQRRISRETQSIMGSLTQILDESLSGQRIVKIFGGTQYEINRFAKVNNLVRRLTVKRASTSSLNSGFTVFLIAVMLACLIYFAGLRAEAGALTAGEFVAFITSMMMLQQPIKNLTKLNDQIHRGLAAAESVFAAIDQNIEEDTGTHETPRAKGELQYQDVTFRYSADSERAALDGINLTIRPGETVALVGKSGGGKTTTVNLLPRFYEPTAGQILLDGVPLPEYRLANLRRQIAMVSQDVVLFNDTVAANIAYGADQIDMDRVRAAAKAAHALDFIEQMQGGFEEMLGENGVRLSGGQRQRMAIARALYKDAPILILDEATSALDTESERHVQAALETLMQGRTTLVIAHRLSTIENADRIVVMLQGKIAEMGTHAELIAADGVYARMHAVQFAQD